MANNILRDHAGQRNNYQPTSLDFINRPNPVEPSAISHGDFSNSSRQLERQTNEEMLRVLQGPRKLPTSSQLPQQGSLVRSQVPPGSIASVLNNEEGGAPPRSILNQQLRRDLDQSYFTLPELPVKRGVRRQRQRVPPVLQGLHQPPPNARLLPSISTEDKQAPSRPVRDVSSRPTLAKIIDSSSSFDQNTLTVTDEIPAPSNVQKRNKWTDEETEHLLTGVARFGVGNWKKISTCKDYSFNERTATDLKDRFRVCYASKQPKVLPPQASSRTLAHSGRQESSDAARKYTLPDSPIAADQVASPLAFPESKRRKRTPYAESEDAALLKGFKKYGASWSSIQLDPVLKKRTATDLRDRFRTRYAGEYHKAGLTIKSAKTIKSANSPQELRSGSDTLAIDLPSNSSPSQHRARATQGPSSAKTVEKSKLVHPAPNSSLEDSWLTDLHLPDDDDDFDTDPIVLDRSIMDWANQNLPSMTSIRTQPEVDLGTLHGIDPLITLNLPRPGVN